MPFIDNAGKWGYRKAVWAALMSRVRRWFILSVINVIRIEDYPAITGLGDRLAMRRATYEDLLLAIEEHPVHYRRAFVEDALARGDYCVGAFDGAHMVAWAWASFTTAPHGDGLWVEVQAPYTYGYKWFTEPEYRGQGIIRQLAISRDKIGAESGALYNVGFTETHNYASLESSRRLGAVRVGYAGYFKLFGKAYPFRTPGVVKHTLRFYRHA